MACCWAIIKSHGNDTRTFASSYIRSVYYALVMSTTVGYGDVAPSTVSETWFAVVAGAVTGGGLTVIANAPNPACPSIVTLNVHAELAKSARR